MTPIQEAPAMQNVSEGFWSRRVEQRSFLCWKAQRPVLRTENASRQQFVSFCFVLFKNSARFYEPVRLSTPPKPLFSLKPRDATIWLRSLLSKVFHTVDCVMRVYSPPSWNWFTVLSRWQKQRYARYLEVPFLIGHLHDDIILLLRPESFMVLLSCAN